MKKYSALFILFSGINCCAMEIEKQEACEKITITFADGQERTVDTKYLSLCPTLKAMLRDCDTTVQQVAMPDFVNLSCGIQ